MLTGSFVRLRPLEITDLDRCVAWINDPEVKRYLNARYFMSRLAEEEWLRGQAARPIAYDHAVFAIDTLAGRHIGTVGLSDTRPETRQASLGILIGEKDCWDQGYGTDAVRTLLRFAFDEMNLNRVWLHVNEDNARAIACYRKCGFVEEGRLRQDRFSGGVFQDTIVMGVLAAEFSALVSAESRS
jgi:RimJ/RimL family protein N-acetyltransferase